MLSINFNYFKFILLFSFILYSCCQSPNFDVKDLKELEILFDEAANKSIDFILKQLEQSDVTTRSKRSVSEFPDWYPKTLGWCQGLLDKLIDVTLLENIAKDVYFIDDPRGIHLDGDIHFESLSVLDKLESSDVTSTSGFSHGEIVHTSFKTINYRLTKIEEELTRIKQYLANAMKLNGEQKVTGSITFDNAYFNCGVEGCNISSIETVTLNGRNVKDLASKVIRLDRDQRLVDHFNISRLFVEDLRANFINNIVPTDIVTRDSDHSLNGSVTFEGSVAVNQLIVPGTINGIKINRQTVLTTTDSQVITTPISFDRGIFVKDLHVEGRLAQVGTDFNTFLSNIVQVDSNRTISGRKTFNTLSVDNLLVNGGIINGFNLTDLSRNLLTRDGPQTITGHVKVDDLIIKGDAWVENINSNKFDEVIVRAGAPIKGDKIFNGSVNIRSMEIEGYLNGRPIVNRSLGLLLKSGSQLITGSKVFRNIKVSQIYVYGGKVGPLDVGKLERKMSRMIQGGKDRILSGPIRLDSIKVEGLINGINLTSLMNDYLKVNQTVIPRANLSISTAIFQNSIKCDTINGHRFPDDFLTVETDQIVPGKTFISNDLTVMSTLNITHINDYPLNKQLWDSLTTNGDQNITGHKKIDGNLYVKNLYIDRLNNNTMKDLVLLNGNGIISGNKSFNFIHVEGPSSAISINGVQSINNISFHELFDNSITESGYQSISPPVRVKKLIIPADTNINVTKVAGLNLTDILSSAIYLHSNQTQTIRGKKVFNARTTFGNLEFHKTFAGYTRDAFNNNYLNSETAEIHGDISIKSDLIVDDNLYVKGNINDFNTKHLKDSLLVHDKPIIINRPMKFRHVRVISGNVNSPLINGIQFGKEMINRKLPVTLNNDAHFPNGVTVNTLTVTSTINNVSISGSICDPIKHAFSNDYSITILGNVMSYASIQASRINGTELNREKVNHITHRSLKGVKKFKKLIIKGPINLGGRLNNIYLPYLIHNYLSLTSDQEFDSEVILRNVTFSGTTYIGGHLRGQNVLLNGVDLNQFTRSVLQKNGDQLIVGNFSFPGKVIFRKGLLNSPSIIVNNTRVNLNRDLFIKSRPNQFDSTPIFNGGIATDRMTSNEQSNLNHIIRKIESFTSSPHFHGWKNFTSLEVDDLQIATLNGKPFASILRKNSSAFINGTIVCEDDLEIRNNLTVLGTVNGVNIKQLESKLVLNGKNNTINPAIIFGNTVELNKPPSQFKRDTRALLDGTSIPKKIELLKRKLKLNEQNLRELGKRLPNS